MKRAAGQASPFGSNLLKSRDISPAGAIAATRRHDVEELRESIA
jgi:hypothetical protein